MCCKDLLEIGQSFCFVRLVVSDWLPLHLTSKQILFHYVHLSKQEVVSIRCHMLLQSILSCSSQEEFLAVLCSPIFSTDNSIIFCSLVMPECAALGTRFVLTTGPPRARKVTNANFYVCPSTDACNSSFTLIMSLVV